MNTHDGCARPNPDAKQIPSSDDETIERQVKQYQAEFLGGRAITYYVDLAEKLAVLIDELEMRSIEERPIETLDRLRALSAEIQGNIKSMKKNPE